MPSVETLAPGVTEEELISIDPNQLYDSHTIEVFPNGPIPQVPMRHSKVPLRTLYDAEGNPRQVPVSNILICLASGLSLRCPKCNGNHESPDPNVCPARPKRKFWQCGICAQFGRVHKVWDRDQDAGLAVDAGPDSVTFGDPSTAEDRLREKAYMHMSVFHPQEAMARGIPVDKYRAGR